MVQVTYSAALSPAAVAAICTAAGRRSDGGRAGGGLPLEQGGSSASAAHGGNGGGAGVRASAAGRFSALAEALGRPAERACLALPVVLGTRCGPANPLGRKGGGWLSQPLLTLSRACSPLHRGPGAVLGDDGIRDRRLAVGVVAAESGVVTLRVSLQRFLASLDPLTLRLFGRLRQQQEQSLQVRRVVCSSKALGRVQLPMLCTHGLPCCRTCWLLQAATASQTPRQPCGTCCCSLDRPAQQKATCLLLSTSYTSGRPGALCGARTPQQAASGHPAQQQHAAQLRRTTQLGRRACLSA
jgi:hypothetical protein